jgi:DegV family protein with EDD domain
MTIRFITDSLCESPSSLSALYEFDVLPIPIIMGEKTYYDGIDLTYSMVIDYVKNNRNAFPKTAQVQPAIYIEAFEKHLKNSDDVIYLALSSKLSGTCQTAELIARELIEKYPERKIAVIDSLSASSATTMIFHQGLKLDRLSRSFEEIVETMEFLTRHIQIYFLTGDLKWMAQGGRINRSAAVIGDTLKIMPMLVFEDGAINVAAKIRGKKKALKHMYQCVMKKMNGYTQQIVGFYTCDTTDMMEKVKKTMEKDHGITNFMIPDGPSAALTVHLGPTALGIVFFDELPDNYVNVCP